VPDAAFAHPRLAPLYDLFDDDRSDLDVYLAIAGELGARSVLDVGCGTGTFALLLAERGMDVVAVDPAQASLDVAWAKPGAGAVRWLHGDAATCPPLGVDLATMTGNVAQAIVEPPDWHDTLHGIHAALRPGGVLVFETRNPARRAWEEWTREATHRSLDTETGRVERWVDVTAVRLPLVTFRTTFSFGDGTELVSESTLRFRERDEVEADLLSHGYELLEIRDAPDRPGREFVFFARRA
jgi:SAM-dependent methyltransferase